MKFIMDFKADWHDTLKKIMNNEWGMDTTGLTDVPVHYFNAAQRRISVRPRTILISDTFQCPAEHLAGWELIQQKVKGGQDLTPHLSKYITRTKKTDLMLNDWGIHHLHLGTRIENGFVERAGPLLFARITDEHFYAIDVYDHASWTNGKIVETVHRNWPESVTRWVMNGVQGERLTDEERTALRKVHANSFFLTKDGTTYGPLGGGTVASGHSIFSVIQMDIEHDRLECLERRLVAVTDELVCELKKAGYKDAAEVTVKLALTEGFYAAFFPEYKLLVNVYPRTI
ncbi:hypothetical protein [Pseudomonas fluorescens]|uniref:hypothetical protein n=1 Tax=Pseudomonas fluorescens TaxID=294 RepID=UPI002B1D11E5|nr:hypothetical protein [Pseudomonas fluorescens]